MTSWDHVARLVDLACRPAPIDLVGPKGFVHGWIKVGPGSSDVHTVDVGSFENDKVQAHVKAAKALASAGKYAAAADHLTTAARHAKDTHTQRQITGARNALLISHARATPNNFGPGSAATAARRALLAREAAAAKLKQGS